MVAEYAAVVSVGLESFDWRTHGDEWMHRVGECLAETELDISLTLLASAQTGTTTFPGA